MLIPPFPLFFFFSLWLCHVCSVWLVLVAAPSSFVYTHSFHPFASTSLNFYCQGLARSVANAHAHVGVAVLWFKLDSSSSRSLVSQPLSALPPLSSFQAPSHDISTFTPFPFTVSDVCRLIIVTHTFALSDSVHFNSACLSFFF